MWTQSPLTGSRKPPFTVNMSLQRLSRNILFVSLHPLNEIMYIKVHVFYELYLVTAPATWWTSHVGDRAYEEAIKVK